MIPSTTAGAATFAADSRASSRARALGWAALACWLLHAADCVFRLREPLNLLWGCNLACLAAGAGLLLDRPRVAAVGVLWLAFGVPIWVLDLLCGGEFIASAAVTHVGGLAFGAAGFAGRGFPAGAWRDAALAAFALQELSRWATPPAQNVNLASAVWPGWEAIFPSYPLYRLTVMTTFVAVFWGGERALRRLFSGPR